LTDQTFWNWRFRH